MCDSVAANVKHVSTATKQAQHQCNICTVTISDWRIVTMRSYSVAATRERQEEWLSSSWNGIRLMLSAMEMLIASRLYLPPKTSLTFLSLPVLFLFAHAAGMVGLRVAVF